MTDTNNDGIPDNVQGLGGDDFTSRDAGDVFSRAMNDPGIRRGLRIGGRFAIGYLIFAAIMFVVVLGFIVFVATKVFSS